MGINYTLNGRHHILEYLYHPQVLEQQSVQAAKTKYHKLHSLEATKICSSQFWRLVDFLYPHLVKGAMELSWSLFYKGMVPIHESPIFVI